MAERRNIVIAGAGIGGLTAALTLAARNFHVIVCERSEKLSEVGAGIQLSPNAGRVLASLGLDKKIAAVASEPTFIDIRSGQSGRMVTSIPMAPIGERYGFPWRVIARAGLQAVLAEAVMENSNIELRLGTKVTDFIDGTDELLLGTETNKGRTIQLAAALIAADGVHSELREKIPGASIARPIGRTAWRATLPARSIEHVIPAIRTGLWLGPEAHLVHYPIASGRTINIVATVAENWKGVGWSEPGDHYWLAENFADWAAAAQRIIAAPAGWLKWALLGVDATGSWVADRVALLGDAAHAMPPFLAQGAAMAIEDAAVLAECFSRETDIATALRSYEAARRPRAARVSKAALETGRYYHFGQPLAAIRNTALRAAGSRLTVAKNDWIYGWKLNA